MRLDLLDEHLTRVAIGDHYIIRRGDDGKILGIGLDGKQSLTPDACLVLFLLDPSRFQTRGMSNLPAPGALVMFGPVLPHTGNTGTNILALMGTQLALISIDGSDQLRNGRAPGAGDIQLDRIMPQYSGHVRDVNALQCG